MKKKWIIPLCISVSIIVVNFCFSYFDLSSKSKTQIIQILENSGYTGYNIRSFNLPLSILFGSPVEAVSILEKKRHFN